MRIDIPNELVGVSFEDAWKNKKIVAFENVSINFIVYNDLLLVKQKTGRPQDIADVDKLKKRNSTNK